MKYVIALAAIPVALALAPAMLLSGQRRSGEASLDRLAAKPIMTEGVRVQRMDATTFRVRWLPVSDLPPTREIIHEPLLLVSHEAPLSMAAAGAPVRPPLSRKVSLRTDLCARHGMRKVHYGKRWRCRR